MLCEWRKREKCANHQKGTHGIRAVVDAYDVCFLHGSLGVDRVFLRLVPAPFRRAGNAKVKLFYSFCAYFMLYYFFFFCIIVCFIVSVCFLYASVCVSKILVGAVLIIKVRSV